MAREQFDAHSDVLPVAGVELATQEAGIRYPNRRDLVAIRFSEGTQAAAVFTTNAFCAAPVIVAREAMRLCANQPRVLLINTGNANAGTGEPGLLAAQDTCRAIAEAVSVKVAEVLPFSTGVIGEDLPIQRILDALPSLCSSFDAKGWEQAAWGILTTDTKPKLASRLFSIDDKTYTLTGIAKGAGMLRPNMATMLAFLATDAPIAHATLDRMLREAVEQSFHRITVDGDTSTNDAVLLAATGAAGGALCESLDSPLGTAFMNALTSLSLELAKALVKDGEGVTKLVQIDVSGGAHQSECLDVAFTVAHSPLVKTALFAADPNWGRLLAAIGRSGIDDIDVSKVSIAVDGQVIASAGCRAPDYDEQAVAKIMDLDSFCLSIDLGRGGSKESVWTSDFSYDYVRINAEYRS